MSADAAGVARMPSCATTTLLRPLPAASFRMICASAGQCHRLCRCRCQRRMQGRASRLWGTGSSSAHCKCPSSRASWRLVDIWSTVGWNQLCFPGRCQDVRAATWAASLLKYRPSPPSAMVFPFTSSPSELNRDWILRRHRTRKRWHGFKHSLDAASEPECMPSCGNVLSDATTYQLARRRSSPGSPVSN